MSLTVLELGTLEKHDGTIRACALRGACHEGETDGVVERQTQCLVRCNYNRVNGNSQNMALSLTILCTLVVEILGLKNVGKLMEYATSRIRCGVHAVWACHALEVGCRGERCESKETGRKLENHCVRL